MKSKSFPISKPKSEAIILSKYVYGVNPYNSSIFNRPQFPKFLTTYVASFSNLRKNVIISLQTLDRKRKLRKDLRERGLFYVIEVLFKLILLVLQNQPFRDDIIKRCSEICSKFTGENPSRCSSIEITLQHGCSPSNLQHIFRTSLPKKTSGGLLLVLLLLH